MFIDFNCAYKAIGISSLKNNYLEAAGFGMDLDQKFYSVRDNPEFDPTNLKPKEKKVTRGSKKSKIF